MALHTIYVPPVPVSWLSFILTSPRLEIDREFTRILLTQTEIPSSLTLHKALDHMELQMLVYEESQHVLELFCGQGSILEDVDRRRVRVQ